MFFFFFGPFFGSVFFEFCYFWDKVRFIKLLATDLSTSGQLINNAWKQPFPSFEAIRFSKNTGYLRYIQFISGLKQIGNPSTENKYIACRRAKIYSNSTMATQSVCPQSSRSHSLPYSFYKQRNTNFCGIIVVVSF